MKDIIDNFLIKKTLHSGDIEKFVKGVCMHHNKSIDDTELQGILVVFQVGMFSLHGAMKKYLVDAYPNHTLLYNKNKEIIQINYGE